MVLQLDGNLKSEDQNSQVHQRDPGLSTTIEHDHFFTSESSVTLLIPPRFPYGSMGVSLLFHAVVFLTLAFVQLPRKKTSWIDVEHEKITYYQISQNFPDISPSLTKTQSLELRFGGSGQPNRLPQFRSETEVAIRPTKKKPAPLFLEQPQLLRVTTLPQFELPNLLMNRPKTEAGEEPISVSQTVVRDLNREAQQKITIISAGLRAELGVSDPLPMRQSPYLQERDLKSVVPNTTPQLSMSLPVEPPTVTPEVSQLEYRAKSFGAGASLVIAPPLDEPKEKGEIGQVPSRIGDTILIYSASPVLPKGELRIPKTGASGNLNASPEGGSGKGAGSGAPEFGNASLAMAGVSIKNRVPLLTAGAGVAVIQAPKPPAPREEERKEDKPIPRPNVLLPPLHRALKLPSYEEAAKKLSSESPLEEVEKEGKQVYTTTISALNLTSKRGSWVFRFTDLSDTSKPVPAGNGDDPTNGSLTPLSAVVKVDPRYPPEAIRGKVEGVVVLYAIIREDGKVDPESVRLIRKLEPRLDLSAKEALLQWRFKPSQKKGRPVDIQAEISVPFYFRREPLQP